MSHISPSRRYDGIPALFFLFALIVVSHSARADFAGGDGSPENPWQIETAAQLDAMRNNLTAHYELIGNIDLVEEPWSNGWEPIGQQFSGTLDGNGFAIHGLYVNEPDGLAGLFRSLDGKVSNLALIDVEIHSGAQWAAALAPDHWGLIEDVHVSGNVTSTAGAVGMIAGASRAGSTIRRSSAVGTVQASGRVGGLTGELAGRIERSWADVGVTGLSASSDTVGGLAGLMFGTDQTAEIVDSHAHGDVHSGFDAEGRGAGGLVGSFTNGVGIRRSYATGAVTTASGPGGGLFGHTQGTVIVEDSYWDTESTGTTTSAGGGTGLSSVEMRERDSFGNWDFLAVWSLDAPDLNNGYPMLRWSLPADMPMLDKSLMNINVENPVTLDVDLSSAFSDPQDLALTFSASNLPPEGATISEAGVLSLRSPTGGVYELMITATNTEGRSVSGLMTLTVAGRPGGELSLVGNGIEVTDRIGAQQFSVTVDNTGTVEPITVAKVSSADDLPSLSLDFAYAGDYAVDTTAKLGIVLTAEDNSWQLEIMLGELGLWYEPGQAFMAEPMGGDAILVARAENETFDAVIIDQGFMSGGAPLIIDLDFLSSIDDGPASDIVQSVLQQFQQGGAYQYRIAIQPEESGAPAFGVRDAGDQSFKALSRMQSNCPGTPHSQSSAVFPLLDDALDLSAVFPSAHAMQGVLYIGQTGSLQAPTPLTEDCAAAPEPPPEIPPIDIPEPPFPVPPPVLPPALDTARTALDELRERALGDPSSNPAEVRSDYGQSLSTLSQVMRDLTGDEAPDMAVLLALLESVDDAFLILDELREIMDPDNDQTADLLMDLLVLQRQIVALITAREREAGADEVDDRVSEALNRLLDNNIEKLARMEQARQAQMEQRARELERRRQQQKEQERLLQELAQRKQEQAAREREEQAEQRRRAEERHREALEQAAAQREEQFRQQQQEEERRRLDQMLASGTRAGVVNAGIEVGPGAGDLPPLPNNTPPPQVSRPPHGFWGVPDSADQTVTFITGLVNMFGTVGLSAPVSGTGIQIAGLGITQADESSNEPVVTWLADQDAYLFQLPSDETYLGIATRAHILPPDVGDGVHTLQHGATLLVDGTLGLEVSPFALDLNAFASELAEMGFALSQQGDGTVLIELGADEHFSGAFAYDNLYGQSTQCDAVSIEAPTGSPLSPDYRFAVICDGGAVQHVTPAIHDEAFYDVLLANGLAVSTDRNTGLLVIEDVGQFRPDYFVLPLTAEQQAWLAENAGPLDVALQATDVNNNGITDYLLLSAAGVQVIFGL